MIQSWEEAVAYALSLPDTELSTSYWQAGRQGRLERPCVSLYRP